MAPPKADHSANPFSVRMGEMYKSGLTLREIGEHFGVNASDVHYRLKCLGISRIEGGFARAVAQRELEKSRAATERLNARRMRVYGCSHTDLVAILGDGVLVTGNKACKAYLQQKKSAGERGIDFLMTFSEWWSVWQESGYWNERGRGTGYVMARKGDIGPYAVGNVFICTASQNSKDGFIKTPASVRKAKRAITMKNRCSFAEESHKGSRS